MIRLHALMSAAGLAVLAAGTGHAQTPERPSYNELLEAVSHADCARAESDDFLRFICRESGAVWYFTKEGMAAHPAYQSFPAWQRMNETPDLRGAFSSGADASTRPGESTDAYRVRTQALRDWTREVFDTWRRTQPRVE